MTVEPHVPANPWVWIDPHLLQLAGLGTKDDPYAQNGIHLRWFFGRLLGFPRTGFRLFRRRRPFDDFSDLRPLLPLFGGQVTNQEALDGGGVSWFSSGLTVAKDNGFHYTNVAGQSDGPYLRIDSRRIDLSIGPQDSLPKPAWGPTASNPAAYVMLTIMRRTTGYVRAEGFYTSGGTKQFQSRAEIGDPQAQGCNPFFGMSGTWQQEQLILDGGLLERIEIIGREAVLLDVRWLPTRSYSQAPGWEVVDDYRLPNDVREADARLHVAPPRALAPWDVATMPPPAASSAAIDDDLKKRYLTPFTRIRKAIDLFLEGEQTQLVPQALVEVPETLTWEGEAPSAGGASVMFRPFDMLYSAAADPQMARLLGLMTTDRPAATGSWDYMIAALFPIGWYWWSLFPEEMKKLFDSIDKPKKTSMQPEARAAERMEVLHAQVARVMSDDVRASMVNANGMSSADFNAANITGIAPPQPLFPSFPVVSIATSLTRSAVGALPDAPENLSAVASPRPGAKKVQSEVAVTWDAPQVNLFDEPRRARIFYAVRRQGSDGDVAVHEKDDETGVRLPIVPTQDQKKENAGRAKITDRSIPAYGTYTWRVSGMDLWGRFSPFASASANVVDEVAPVAPSNIVMELNGQANSAPQWDSLVVAFDWTKFQQDNSPDATAFDVHVRQGKVPTAQSQNAATWGVVEHEAGATTAPLRIDRVTGAVLSALPSGLTVNVAVTDIVAEGSPVSLGKHYVVTFAPVKSPFDADGFTYMSATVTARDAGGNVSAFASRAFTQRVDDAPPPQVTLLPGPRFTAYPDARGRAHYRIPLGIPAGMTARVLRATQRRLLEAAGMTDAQFDALADDGARVAKLKDLAVLHRGVFTADHEMPYGPAVKEHIVGFNGLERMWSVATVQLTSNTGVPAAWPSNGDGFVVIAVRRAAERRTPVVSEARPGDRTASLRVLPDPTGATQHVRIYRTRTRDNAAEIRMMKPVQDVDMAGVTAAGVVFQDVDLIPDATYFYRAVAHGAGTARSLPTEIITVRAFSTVAPPAPQVVSVKKPLGLPTQRDVVFRIPRRDYRISVLRRGAEDPDWLVDDVDLATLTVAPSGTAYQVQLSDTVPVAAAKYTYRIRITDPRERVAESASVEESA